MKYTFVGIILLLMAKLPAAQDKTGQETVNPVPGEDGSSSLTQMIRQAIETGKKDTSAADKIFRKAIAISIRENNDFFAGKAFYEMGEMYFNHKNHNKSFGSFFNARDYFKKAGAEKEEAYTLFGLGRQQYYRGNYKVAAGHLNYAIRAAEKMKLTALGSDALEYLGILYHLMPGTAYQGTSYLKKSLAIKQRLKDRNGTLRVLEKLGEVYHHQKYFDSSLQYLNQSINLAIELKLFHDADLSRLNRVGTYIRLNKMKEAEKELALTIANTRDTGDLNIMIRYFIQKGNYFTAEGKFEEGKNNYDKALAVAGRIGVPEMYGMVYQNMAEAYGYKGLFKEAYEFLEQYTIQLTGYYAENIPTIKELELILHTNLTKDEVAYLSAENKLKEIRHENDKMVKKMLTAGAIVFLLLAAVIYYFYCKQKIKNSIIKKQGEELQTLMKEVDHRVKNNLQIISSILDMQSMIIKDSQAAQAVKECRNRVQNMALIHQDLYSEKNISGIAIDAYIHDLAQNLFHTYNIRPDQVVLKVDIEKMNLDTDTVIPIGLVLNELISNSLKYAFNETDSGIIEVRLERNNDILFLQVKDNGKGFPGTSDPSRYSSFGMRMIKAFAQKLKADLEIYNDNGACVAMKIRKYKVAA